MFNRLRFLNTSAALIVTSTLFGICTLATAQSQGPRPDNAIQSDVETAFSQDSTLQGQHLSVAANKGIVTLSGTVQTEAERQAAESDASNVTGVSGIIDHLTVTNPDSANSSAGLAAQTSANQVAPQDQQQNQRNEAPSSDGSDAQQQSAVPPPPPDVNQPQNGSAPAPPPGYNAPYQQGYPPQPRAPYSPTASTPVTIPAGTLLRVRLNEPLDTAHLQDGAIFQVTNAVDVYQNGVLAIPRGATLTGRVVETKQGEKGQLKGAAILRIQLTNLNLAGNVFPLTTDVWSSEGPGKGAYTARNTAGGAILGAIIGGIIGRGAGAAVGAGVGAVGGLAASSATAGPRIYLPAEALVDFHLAAPVTVQPVSWQEARRLAATMPALVQRPRPMYPPPGPYYRPYPYAYPYPY